MERYFWFDSDSRAMSLPRLAQECVRPCEATYMVDFAGGVDLSTGDIRWKVPIGMAPGLAGKGIKDTGPGAMHEGSFSVMEKKQLPPIGDKHDYMSLVSCVINSFCKT